MNWKHFVIPGLLMMTLYGCSDEQKEKPQAEEKPETEDQEQAVAPETTPEETSEPQEEKPVEIIPLPETLNELAGLTPGHTGYLATIEAEDQKKIDELTKDLPDISGKPSEEELDAYYSQLLSVFQQDYEGPEDLINQLKFQSIGSPDVEDPRMQFKENLNVMVILDASGSMGKNLGNQTQMDAAKSAITNFVQGLPENANVGLRIYGQEGTGSSADKALSCGSSELIYPIGKYNPATFTEALTKAVPAGWTPIQLALNEAQKDLASFKGDQNTNIVYLVSDGISTCDDDPVAAAKSLYNSDITPIVNVIGFNVDSEGQKQLKAVADATNGSYQDVQNAQGLQDQLDQAKKVAEKWKMWKTSQEGNIGLEQTNNYLDIFGYHAGEYKKFVDERQQVGFTLTYLLQKHEKMSQQSHDYLIQKNTEYHAWIEQEYDKLKKELEVLNDKNYQEAIQSLEDTYQQNATP
jgi:Ca-activated chloride channel homolog